MHSAAFFRVEGTLVRRNSLAAAAWLALNDQRVRGRLARLANVALAAPLALAERTAATKAGWSALRGTTEDRLRVLGEEYWATQLKGSLDPVGLRLIEAAKREERLVVLVSDHPRCVVRHLAEHLGAAALVCNELELDAAGKATGALRKPVVGGAQSGQWARGWAAEHDVDLLLSRGYGAHRDDAVLLSAVGQPCAVHPDRSLRATARDLSWPVLDA